mmetsp:Transcript_58629/g.63299  ORF Transcript_58629/g.63299 Transcript_58629/m.63299 type:complete len:81 (+) Transcript_58629:644-886(+)
MTILDLLLLLEIIIGCSAIVMSTFGTTTCLLFSCFGCKITGKIGQENKNENENEVDSWSQSNTTACLLRVIQLQYVTYTT